MCSLQSYNQLSNEGCTILFKRGSVPSTMIGTPDIEGLANAFICMCNEDLLAARDVHRNLEGQLL